MNKFQAWSLKWYHSQGAVEGSGLGKQCPALALELRGSCFWIFHLTNLYPVEWDVFSIQNHWDVAMKWNLEWIGPALAWFMQKNVTCPFFLNVMLFPLELTSRANSISTWCSVAIFGSHLSFQRLLSLSQYCRSLVELQCLVKIKFCFKIKLNDLRSTLQSYRGFLKIFLRLHIFFQG